MSTLSFENFEYAHNRLDALYMQLFEEHNNYREAMLDLLKDLIVMQIVASGEAYELDLTRQILDGHLHALASSKKAKNAIIGLLTSPSGTTTWNTLFEEILATGTRCVTDEHNFENWITWLSKNGLSGLAVPKQDRLLLQEILATRNLLAHHRGTVNNTYINRTEEYFKTTGQKAPHVGGKRPISPAYCQEAIKCFYRAISAIDVEASKVIG